MLLSSCCFDVWFLVSPLRVFPLTMPKGRSSAKAKPRSCGSSTRLRKSFTASIFRWTKTGTEPGWSVILLRQNIGRDWVAFRLLFQPREKKKKSIRVLFSLNQHQKCVREKRTFCPSSDPSWRIVPRPVDPHVFTVILDHSVEFFTRCIGFPSCIPFQISRASFVELSVWSGDQNPGAVRCPFIRHTETRKLRLLCKDGRIVITVHVHFYPSLVLVASLWNGSSCLSQD